MADNLKDAIRYFCMKHEYTLLESEEDWVRVEDKNGADMKYSISW